MPNSQNFVVQCGVLAGPKHEGLKSLLHAVVRASVLRLLGITSRAYFSARCTPSTVRLQQRCHRISAGQQREAGCGHCLPAIFW